MRKRRMSRQSRRIRVQMWSELLPHARMHDSLANTHAHAHINVAYVTHNELKDLNASYANKRRLWVLLQEIG